MTEPRRAARRLPLTTLLLAAVAACNQGSPVAGRDPEPGTLPSYAIRQLGLLPGGLQSQARYGNDAARLVVGWANDAAGGRRAVTFAGGAASRLPELAGTTRSEATWVNARGLIVGYNTVGGRQRAVLWASPTAAPVLLPTLGGTRSTARAINASGLIVGTAANAQDSSFIVLWRPDGSIRRLDPRRGFNYSPASLTDDGRVAGNAGADDAAGATAFRWDSLGGFIDIEDIDDANGMNDDGVIIGNGDDPQGRTRLIRWSERRGGVLMGEPPAGFAEVTGSGATDDIVVGVAANRDAAGNVTTGVAAITRLLEESRQFTALPQLAGSTRSGVTDGGVTECGVALGFAFPAGTTTNRVAVAWVPEGCSIP